LLKERGVKDVLVIGGGIIPPEDIPFLKEKGVAEIFGPGTMVKEIAEYIRQNVKPR
jgi:methylmalonyl-CoA mutase C-terminal domain/subunit